jgi:hypothetical protein
MTNWGPKGVQTRDQLGMSVTKTLVNENFWICQQTNHPQSMILNPSHSRGEKEKSSSRQKSIDLVGSLGGGSVIVCHVKCIVGYGGCHISFSTHNMACYGLGNLHAQASY